MNYMPPASSVYGISQARILERVAISSSRGSFWHRDPTQVSYIAGRFFTVCARVLNPVHAALCSTSIIIYWAATWCTLIHFSSNCTVYPSSLMQIERQKRTVNSTRSRGVFLSVNPRKEINGVCVCVCVYSLIFSFHSPMLLMTFICFLDEIPIPCLAENLLYD